MEEQKFEDLEFVQQEHTSQAIWELPNGYALSILLGGRGIYSNGINAYEVGVFSPMPDRTLIYPFEDHQDVYSYQTKEEVKELAEKVSKL